ncbi:MAG: peptidoglycan-associated lipoprotein Pal [Candidatus Competibacteraceae bacterium]|jgi:peptidoglycan-associated lipoprotein|nr:peptidoglycan-associated lipoprotein Pal [Candidatus Competibacteraceae bacterium]
MNSVFKICFIMLLGLLLSSCASTAYDTPAETPDAGQTATQSQGLGQDQYPGTGYYPGSATGTEASSYPYQSGTVPGGQPLSGAVASSDRVIYFAFDSFEVSPEYWPTIEVQARYLIENPSAATVLEGHADERGTREYNIALGERRAEAVRQVMIAYGVSPQQVRTLSYGEERPAVDGSSESSYAQNRRVEIVY